jgi:hypothetical protein
MERKLAAAQQMRSGHGAAGSMACLLFVMMLSGAFWAGAIWIAESLIRISGLR